MKKKNRLTLADIIVTVMIATVFAVVYRLWSPVTDVVGLFGLQLEQLIYGMWFIAGTIAALIIKKPFVALIAETAAASGEFIAGSPYGGILLIYGILQGIGMELAFALFRYKVYSIWTAMLGGVFASFASIGLDFLYANIGQLTTWALVVRVSLRTIGAILITGVLAAKLVQALQKTGVLDSFGSHHKGRPFS
ncbi:MULTISPECIES: ECF transporter S component [Shouchella]|uniref:ECF transporter S component n=2 Tax=Shouchella TaxID=2893057 RepID=A0ABY7W2Q1_9BACI|nr:MULTISPECIES: ECF transporter S component [Shouchella]MED4129884.1 ECF transporter S component [Shouchella miscanthi]WDF03227.1 ECF transporter S component [Shouchella hunanensis]GAF23024.1 substrate-specific component YkoE [Bacillus sp. JCM 19047]